MRTGRLAERLCAELGIGVLTVSQRGKVAVVTEPVIARHDVTVTSLVYGYGLGVRH